MALDPLAQLVPDRAQPEFGLERLECGFQFGQSPVSTNRLLNAPLRVAGAQDQSTRLILKYRSCLDLKVIVWGKFFARHEGLFRGHAGSIA